MVVERSRPLLASWTAAALMVLAGWGAAPVSSGNEDPAAPYAEIESIELHREGTVVFLSVVSTGELRWTARAEQRALTLYLDDSLPGPDVSDLLVEEGVVAAVKVRSERGADRPRTTLTVVTRQQADHQVKSWGRVLQVRLRPVEARAPRPTPAPAPVTPPPAAADPAAPRVGTGVATGSEEDAIGVGDLLQVEVFGLDELGREVRVLRDGTISLPLLGNLPVNGLTVQQAERRIAQMLSDRKLVNDPQVYVVVKEHVSRSVRVQGAVRRPGVYEIGGRKTLLEIIGDAGGLEQQTGTMIFILRRSGSGPEERIEINAEQLIEQGDVSLNIPLEPGDIVSVPHQKRHYVYVNGAVKSPGQVEFLSSEGITVLQAITAAGGLTERANAGNIHVIRKLPDGSQERIEIHLKKIKKGKEIDLPLEKNDVVVVGEWFF